MPKFTLNVESVEPNITFKNSPSQIETDLPDQAAISFFRLILVERGGINDLISKFQVVREDGKIFNYQGRKEGNVFGNPYEFHIYYSGDTIVSEHKCIIKDCNNSLSRGNMCLDHKCDKPKCIEASMRSYTLRETRYCHSHSCQVFECNKARNDFKSWCFDHACRGAEQCDAPKLPENGACDFHMCQVTGCHKEMSPKTYFCQEHTCFHTRCKFQKPESQYWCPLHTCKSSGCLSCVKENCEYCEKHTCAREGCVLEKDEGKTYCPTHTCKFPACQNEVACEEHMCTSSGCTGTISEGTVWCEKCGSQNPEKKLFCVICGQPSEVGICKSHEMDEMTFLVLNVLFQTAALAFVKIQKK